MSITVTAFSENLPVGITLDPTAYPGTSEAIKVLVDLLDAFNASQATFNATAPAGTDVLALNSGLGAEQTIFWPAGQTATSIVVRPKTYTLASFQQNQVTNVYPVIG